MCFCVRVCCRYTFEHVLIYIHCIMYQRIILKMMSIYYLCISMWLLLIDENSIPNFDTRRKTTFNTFSVIDYEMNWGILKFANQWNKLMFYLIVVVGTYIHRDPWRWLWAQYVECPHSHRLLLHKVLCQSTVGCHSYQQYQYEWIL